MSQESVRLAKAASLARLKLHREAYLLGYKTYLHNSGVIFADKVLFEAGGQKTNWTRGFWDAKCGRSIEDPSPKIQEYTLFLEGHN